MASSTTLHLASRCAQKLWRAAQKVSRELRRWRQWLNAFRSTFTAPCDNRRGSSIVWSESRWGSCEVTVASTSVPSGNATSSRWPASYARVASARCTPTLVPSMAAVPVSPESDSMTSSRTTRAPRPAGALSTAHSYSASPRTVSVMQQGSSASGERVRSRHCACAAPSSGPGGSALGRNLFGMSCRRPTFALPQATDACRLNELSMARVSPRSHARLAKEWNASSRSKRSRHVSSAPLAWLRSGESARCSSSLPMET